MEGIITLKTFRGGGKGHRWNTTIDSSMLRWNTTIHFNIALRVGKLEKYNYSTQPVRCQHEGTKRATEQANSLVTIVKTIIFQRDPNAN